MNDSTRHLLINLLCWSIGVAAALLAVVTWGQAFAWQTDRLSAYLLFPLCGLLAFSLMWSHYVAGVVRRVGKTERTVIKNYFMLTGYVVLVLICLHPGLLMWQLWRDGFGLPPNSYLEHYVAPSLRWAVMLGTVGFFIFIAYEFRRWFKDKSWWKWIVYAGDLAMFAVFFHALRLGTNLQKGWYRWVWLFYGVSLAASLAFIYYVDRRNASVKPIKGRKRI